MNSQTAPKLDSRRAAHFEEELLERARVWMPTWALADGEGDFGRSVLEIAARFSSEVAEQLDKAGDKMARGFLDWLATRSEAARPARMPVVFKLADTAIEAVDAPRPVRMQVEALSTNVTFETEKDIRLLPGRIDAIVGADPAADAFYLPPPGLSDLGPVEPLPTRWVLKSFASPGSTVLQFDPGAGLVQDMLVEIDGEQYRISEPKDDLATIDPAVPAGNGFAADTPVIKVETFSPFEDARNQQNHIVYFGHADLLNIEAMATLDIVGAQSLSAATWEYWGTGDPKETDADEVKWRSLALAPPDKQQADALVLIKPDGKVETKAVGAASSRWIRAYQRHVGSAEPILSGDGLALRINALPGSPAPAPATPPPLDRSRLPAVEAIVNSTPSPPRNFFPLGREPRLFDTLYVGCAEAFSKQGAVAWVYFDLSAAIFNTITAIEAGTIGYVLAGVDMSGALHLFRLNPDGTLTRLRGREPMTPAEGVKLMAGVAPVMWMDGANLLIAVAGEKQVYVWREVSSDPSQGKWKEPLGTPVGNLRDDATIAGLVLANNQATGDVSLVALRDNRLSARPALPDTAAWTKLSDIAVESIVQIQHENPSLVADGFLAVIAAQAAPVYYELHAVAFDPFAELLIIDHIEKDVRPYGIQLTAAGNLRAVALRDDKQRLEATDTGGGGAIIDLGPDLRFGNNATLGGGIENNELTIYGVADRGNPPSSQELIAWVPFDNQLNDVVFSTRSDPSVGRLRGGVTIFHPLASVSRALLPGNNKGEIFAAELGGSRILRNAARADLRSALAVLQTVPAIPTGDTIAPDVAGVPTPVIVMATAVDGLGSYAGRRFYWLSGWLDRLADVIPVPIYKTSAPAAYSGTVVSDMAPFELQLDAADTVTGVNDLILVDDGTGGVARQIVKVLAVDPMTRVAEIDALPAALNTVVDYWLRDSQIQGSIFPALELNAGNNNWDAAALERADIYFPDLRTKRQRAIAVLTDVSVPPRPLWIAFDKPWETPPAIPAAFRFAVDGALTKWVTLLSDTSSNPALAWEYWNGTGWWHLQVKDGTSHLRNSGVVGFEVPADLTSVDWAGKTNYWIRARLIGGDYGRENVTVTTTPIGTTGVTEQTIKRSTEGIQPPYAIRVDVNYAITDPVVPDLLLTQDSGTLRDQSDANRTPGAQIDVFTPLIYTLGRLGMAAHANGMAECDGCAPDCDCASGMMSRSPVRRPPAARPAQVPSNGDCDCTTGDQTAVTAAGSTARARRRALYIGLTSKVSGEPVNMLFAGGEEKMHDGLAPLLVDVLAEGGFVPVVSRDGTRAIGESGLLTMSFAVEPVSAELFGKTLSWLRLTPNADDAWAPSLRGVYLNAAWARSAETMTRELLGSSEGMPGLTLALARPPLLKDTLELRVKEPLGTEERNRLQALDPEAVKSAVSDLPGDWVLWKQVADPLDHDATARVYSLDEGSGIVQFGDGLHGAIPPIGADVIVAFSYERTEPAAPEGLPANFVTARTSLNLVTPVENVETAIAADQAAGGLAPEPAERVLMFGAATLRHRGRAVTARDFEDLALQRFAGVAQARCFVRGGRVRLIVVMRGANPLPSQAQRRELRRMLLDAAQGALAARGALSIDGPAIRRYRITLKLRVATLDVAGEVGRKAKAAIKSYFDTDIGGKYHTGWPLGASPRPDDIGEALLDIPHLEGIVAAELTEIGERGLEQPWPETLKPGELAFPAADSVRIEFEIMETAA